MADKICPLMSNVVGGHPYGNTDIAPVPCLRHECELWTRAYVTPIERGGQHTEEGCCFRIGAMTNSEGKVPI